MVRPLPLHQTMLRITEVVDSGTETTLHVEGRIGGWRTRRTTISGLTGERSVMPAG